MISMWTETFAAYNFNLLIKNVLRNDIYDDWNANSVKDKSTV